MRAFASYSLELLSPLHLGSRRAGVVAQTWRHAPGHLFVHALAAAAGLRRGGAPTDFAAALDEIAGRFRFGPAFFMRGGERLSDAEVERDLVASSHHVALDGASRSAVDSALFEVEALHGLRGSGVLLAGGVWVDGGADLDARPLAQWLDDIRLGGEQKGGFGRVRCAAWQADADVYPGVGPAGPDGLRLERGAPLPGAALDGVVAAPLAPLLGRRHDARQGFGRRLSQAALVRFDGRAAEAGCFLPAGVEPGMGCWTRISP